jgi:hypothetical protein
LVPSWGAEEGEGSVIPPKRMTEDRPLFPIVQGGKWGYIDQTGKMVIEPQYVDASTFSEGLAAVGTGTQVGYIDKSGRMVIEPKFDFAQDFSEGLAAVQIGGDEKSMYGNWGYIDKTGAVVIKTKFNMAYAFHNGRAMVEVADAGSASGTVYTPGGKTKDNVKFKTPGYGWIDRTGKFVIKPKYMIAFPSAGGTTFVMGFDGSMGVIDENGKFLDENDPLGGREFSEGLAPMKVDEKYGFVDTSGSMVIPAQYDQAYGFSEGVASVKLDGKCCYIDKTGTVAIEPEVEVSIAYDFMDGLALVRVGDEKTGKSGCIDKTGKLVIPAMYDFLGPFTDGLSQVRIGTGEDSKMGYIDKTGAYIWEPSN